MSTTNPQQLFIGRPNHKPTLIFARWVSNRGFLELALPDVGALGGHICGPHGDAACHILDSLICSKKNLSTDMHQGCLVGGLEDFLFSISYMGCHPSH